MHWNPDPSRFFFGVVDIAFGVLHDLVYLQAFPDSAFGRAAHCVGVPNNDILVGNIDVLDRRVGRCERWYGTRHTCSGEDFCAHDLE